MSSDDDELVGDLRSGGDPERVARSAKALVIRADALLDQGSADEALKVLDTVIDALDGSADIEPRKVLALALATKSATLKQLGRRHAMRPFEAMVSQYGNEAVDEFDEEAMRLWSAEAPQDRERLAWVLLTEAMVLEHRGRRARCRGHVEGAAQAIRWRELTCHHPDARRGTTRAQYVP